MSDKTYSQAQFALLMAVEVRKVNPAINVVMAADVYYDFLVGKEGR